MKKFYIRINGELIEYSCVMKSHFRKFGNQSSVAVFTNVSAEIMIRYAQKQI